MGRWVSLTLVTVVLGLGSAVVINNCCPNGTKITEDQTCVPFPYEPWTPKVYSPSLKSLVDIPDDWVINGGRLPACGPSEELFFVAETSALSFILLDNGLLANIIEDPDVPNDLEPGKYCMNVGGYFLCVPLKDGPRLPKVKKCCGNDGVFSLKNESCSALTQNLNVPGFSFVGGFPVCPLGYTISGKLEDGAHRLQPNGSLRIRDNEVTAFCIDYVLEQPNDGVHIFTCSEPSLAPTSNSESDIRFTIYPVGLFLSVFFLGVTLVVSCLLPSTYHVLHWRCQTNHVACLMVGDLLLAITQLSGSALQGPACIAIAVTMHFMILSAFFWLNTMCFNIWWTFRDLRPSTLDKRQEACRLRLYELYAWGGPLAIAGLAAMCDYLPGETYPNLLRPRFGEKRCWFYGDKEIFPYFFGPIAVLLLMNLTLFAATARELTCGLWKTEVVKSNTERVTLGRVCLKLVVVMGVTWVAEVVSWVVGGPNYLWYLTDLINSLQGVLIFAVVGCQPQVWAAVKRFWCLRQTPSDTHNARSSSSNALPSCGEQNTSTTKGMETLC